MNVQEAATLLGLSDAKQEHVLAALIATYPEIKTLNWRSEVAEAFSEHDEIEGLKAAIFDLNFLPDGFVIELDEPGLIFFEVEVHSPMAGEKLRSYGKFAIDLAYYEIAFSVITVNKYGHTNVINLLPYYADWNKRNIQ